jgi:drug/metabolite transporter (DMT)-like permease
MQDPAANLMTDPAARKKIMLQGFLISFAGSILFSTKAIIIKKAFHNTSTDAVTLLTLRMLFALPFYIIVACWQTRKENYIPMSRRQWIILAFLGLFGYYLSSYFDFTGLKYISAGLERLILFLYPSFAVLINAIAFRQRITKVQGWALLLTYIGIGIAYFGEMKIDTGNPNFYWGSFLVFLCAVCYAFYLAGSGKMIPVVGAARFTSYSMIVATGAILLHYVIRSIHEGNHLSGGPALSGGAVISGGSSLYVYAVLLAIVGTVLPTFMISAGMKRIGSNNAAIISSIGPVSTILQAHFFLGDAIFAEQLIGTGLVITGVLLIGWKSGQSTEKKTVRTVKMKVLE